MDYDRTAGGEQRRTIQSMAGNGGPGTYREND